MHAAVDDDDGEAAPAPCCLDLRAAVGRRLPAIFLPSHYLLFVRVWLNWAAVLTRGRGGEERTMAFLGLGFTPGTL